MKLSYFTWLLEMSDGESYSPDGGAFIVCVSCTASVYLFIHFTKLHVKL